MLYNGDENSLSDLRVTIDESVKILEPHYERFDSIVVTGVSGLVVGTPLAYVLGKELVVVRKADDKSTHSFTPVENPRGIGRAYLFVDDFINGGSTLKRVRQIIYDVTDGYDWRPAEAGVLMYADGAVDWNSARFMPEIVRKHLSHSYLTGLLSAA